MSTISGGCAKERYCATAHTAGRPVVCSSASMAAPSPHPPNRNWSSVQIPGTPSRYQRDEVCVPVRDRDTLFVGERVDVIAAADAIGLDTVVDADTGMVAVALDREHRRAALESLTAPDVVLHDLEGAPHALSEWRGQKR